MSVRDIPDLSVLCLKVLAKTPTQFINEKTLKRPFAAYPHSLLTSCTQEIIDYVSEAGRLSDAVFPIDSFNTNRSYLSLKNSKVSSKYILAVLKLCPQLTHLDISGCLPVDDDVVCEVLDLCPSLQNLCVRNCRKLTDEALESITKKAKHITILSIGGNINMTDSGLQRFLRQYPLSSSLQELHVSGLPLSPTVLTAIAQCCPHLRALSLGYCLLPPASLRSLIEALDQLQFLSLAWAEAVTATATPAAPTFSSTVSPLDLLDLVRRLCSRLVSLDLTGMKSINAAALSHLVDYKYGQVSYVYPCISREHVRLSCTKCQSLSLSHCAMTTSGGKISWRVESVGAH